MRAPTGKLESVLDTSTLLIADVYAEATLDLVEDNAAAESVVEEIEAVVGMLAEIDAFKELLTTATLSRRERVELVERIFEARCSETVLSLLATLARRGRLDLLPALARQIRRRLNVRQGKIEVELTLAADVSAEQMDAIREKIRQTLDAEPILNVRVDASLMGGMVMRVGDRVYDASVATKIQQLSAQMAERIASSP